MTDLASSPPSALRRTFFGVDGLRAGWTLLLFLAPFLLLGGAVAVFLHLHPLPPSPARKADDLHPALAGLSEFISFAFIAGWAFTVSFLERRPFRLYGLALRRALPDFIIGSLWGFAALSILVGALLATHSMAFDGVALSGLSALRFAAAWLFTFLSVGLFEEFGFRGILQYTLARGVTGLLRRVLPAHADTLGFWIAALVLSVGFFAWTHTANHGETFLGIFAVGLAGATFAFSLFRTGTLWWAIGFHTAWDWAQSFFYGTPDSGQRSFGHLLATHPLGNPRLSGATAGPEGSLLVIPTLLLVCLVIHLTLPRRAPLVAPPPPFQR